MHIAFSDRRFRNVELWYVIKNSITEVYVRLRNLSALVLGETNQ